MKIFYLFLIFTIVISCNSNKKVEQDEITQTIIPINDTIKSSIVIDSLKLSNAIDSIWISKKVQAKQLEIETLSNNERDLTILQFEEENEITIKLAEDNGLTYVTYFIFYINLSNNYSIEYMDVLEGVRIDFGYWCEQSSLEKNFHDELENTIIGNWTINKIGFGQCNSCPKVNFKKNKKLTVIDAKGNEEQYSWIIDDNHHMRIELITNSENSILNSGSYKYKLSFSKTFMELEIKHINQSTTYIFRK